MLHDRIIGPGRASGVPEQADVMAEGIDHPGSIAFREVSVHFPPVSGVADLEAGGQDAALRHGVGRGIEGGRVADQVNALDGGLLTRLVCQRGEGEQAGLVVAFEREHALITVGAGRGVFQHGEGVLFLERIDFLHEDRAERRRAGTPAVRIVALHEGICVRCFRRRGRGRSLRWLRLRGP